MQGKTRRGQVALEIIVIIGFLVLLIVPTLVQIFMTFGESQEKLAVIQADQTASRLARTIEVVGASGINSSITTELVIPQLITGITVNNNELVFKLQTSHGPTQIVKKIKYSARAENHIHVDPSLANRFLDIEYPGNYFVIVASVQADPFNPGKSVIELRVK
ncbi:Uncharacterised protein [Candidatus Gugararchaeum adminiculabundum]|nr:Uncharacterised protein [Candidatus Gugararchaeum adminiculabundum]